MFLLLFIIIIRSNYRSLHTSETYVRVVIHTSFVEISTLLAGTVPTSVAVVIVVVIIIITILLHPRISVSLVAVVIPSYSWFVSSHLLLLLLLESKLLLSSLVLLLLAIVILLSSFFIIIIIIIIIHRVLVHPTVVINSDT